jgi:hypothetical protein
MTSSFLPGLKNLRSAMTHPSIQTGIVRFGEKSTPVTFFAIRCASFGVLVAGLPRLAGIQSGHPQLMVKRHSHADRDEVHVGMLTIL